jgi:dienelactone hydrolase
MVLVRRKDAPANRARATAAKIRQALVPVETLFIPDVGHGFAGPTAEASKTATDQALARTFACIDTVSPELAPKSQ